MAITREAVHHVAMLARLHLSEREEAEITTQLDQILAYFEVLQQLDTSDVEPTAHVIPMETPFRSDTVTNQPDVERWMANAPSRDGGHFRVPKIIE
jgi:aspartyl-tRNA(Asn)/glutamyl-tRNA(Gln) amidotransferase subunit C